MALGALVAPPDPIAATSVAGSLGLPRRLVSIPEGEGLFNDVTAIVLYHVAIAAAVTGTFSVTGAAGMLALSAVVALAVGFALGWATERLMRLLDDPTLKIGCTLPVPFAAYLVADESEGSGVLAVLVTALYLSEHATDADDVLGRLAERSFWDVVDTLVTGIAFGLIGLELHAVVGSGDLDGALVGAAAAVVGVVVGVRLLWLLPASWLAQRLHRRGGHPDEAEEIPTTWRETVVMWWAGMRGVASVALVLAIPVEADGGGPFPHRGDLLFLTFAVVLATLVCQGLTLPRLVKRLGVSADTEAERRLERRLALRAAKAARARLAEIEQVQELPEDSAEQLQRAAYGIATRLYPDLVDEDRREAHARRLERLRTGREISAELLSAARHELLAARSEGCDPEIVDRVLRQLDVRSVRGGAV
ncbi:Na+/H+ antiporter [Streptomyces synnematoformans]|uniref:Na+/H+ antiporter n=1 Tax=Streptomyces synnematoformans TaxID=415721 RepID=A0ABP5L2P0_9ACTN